MNQAVSQINRKTARQIGDDAMAALDEVANKHGLSVTQKGGSYDNSHFTFKADFSVMNEDGMALTQEAKDLQQLYKQYGFMENPLGQTFKSHGEEFRITGLKVRATKHPITAERVRDGRGFKFPADNVVALLGW